MTAGAWLKDMKNLYEDNCTGPFIKLNYVQLKINVAMRHIYAF